MMNESSISLDSTTRRAFALDSRTVWVEQQLHHQTLIPKDNLPIGPAEYSPKILERHVATPVLGKFRGPADHFRYFHSHLGLKTPSQRSARSKSPPRAASAERTEMVTIFHNHDIREPLDPKLRFQSTPGPYLTHDPALSTKDVFGVHHVKETLPFGKKDVPFGERNPTKKALPSYNVNYDSHQLRPEPLLTTFSKSKRIYIPKKGEKPFRGSCDEEEEEPDDNNDHEQENTMKQGKRIIRARSNSPPGLHHHQSPLQTSGSLQQMSVFEMRCNLVKLPKLKTRHPPKLLFNHSSYRKDQKKMPVTLTPKVVKDKAKVDLFHNLMILPRGHKSAAFA